MKYSLKIEGRTFEVEINDLRARPVIALVDGVAIEVWPEGGTANEPAQPARTSRPQTAPSTPSANPAQASASGTPAYHPPAAGNGGSQAKVVRAPIPGVIVSVFVQPGAEVVEGQELCALEAMKMKNILRSTRAGKIAQVNVQVGQHVKHHDVLMEYAE